MLDSKIKYSHRTLSFPESLFVSPLQLTHLAIGPSMTNFLFLKTFKVNRHHPKVLRILKFLWQLPLLSWIKCNTNSTSLGYGISTYTGTFRNMDRDKIGCFARDLREYLCLV